MSPASHRCCCCCHLLLGKFDEPSECCAPNYKPKNVSSTFALPMRNRRHCDAAYCQMHCRRCVAVPFLFTQQSFHWPRSSVRIVQSHTPAMNIGPLIALLADFIAVPRAWESAAVAYTLLLLTVLLRTETYWLRVGAPGDLKAFVLMRLDEQLRATDLAELIWWSRPTDTELGARRAILTAHRRS